jgi:TonB family protein
MKCFKIFFAAATTLVVCSSPPALAGEIKVIANSHLSVDSISEGELKSIFLEERRSLNDGSHAEPVVEKGGVTHEAFVHEYLGKSADDLQTFYRSLVFSGKGSMPRELGSDAEVVAYIARTKGAIGYVSAEAPTEGVKTLTVVHSGDSAERRLVTRIEPEYPETLKRLNIGGTVRLRLTIAPKGNVENVELLGGNPILGEAASAAVKQWTYRASHAHSHAIVSIPFVPYP